LGDLNHIDVRNRHNHIFVQYNYFIKDIFEEYIKNEDL